MEGNVPVIDFAGYGLLVQDRDSVTDAQLQPLAEDFYTALSTVGFCYIQNHGLPQKTINQLFHVSKEFFTLPREDKDACVSPTGRFNGYQALEKERLTATRPGDLKETFNYSFSSELMDISWPQSVSDMQATFSEFLTKCSQVACRILDVLSLSLKPQDRSYFRSRHRQLGGSKSPGTLRSIYYPPIVDDGSVKPGQLRCGEHSDYGSLALLFQDKAGGLEIMTTGGQFVSVPPIEGTIVVNIGDLMQRWTGDRLKATIHRVIIPEVELKRKQCRQSAVLFVDPDDDVIIDCLDGSSKYEPVSSHDFVCDRIRSKYQN